MAINYSNYSCYIALRSKDLSLKFGSPAPTEAKYFGWLLGNTGYNASIPSAISSAATAAEGAPAAKYFAPAREMRSGVKRDYGGINSSGGPQVSGRADQEDVFIEKVIDGMSPTLYKYVCSAEQFSYIHIYMPADTDFNTGTHVTLKDVSLTSYHMKAVRKEGIHVDYTLNAHNAPTSRVDDPGPVRTEHVESFTLLYTSMKIDIAGGGTHGWDTGTDAAWPAATS